ncbi:MAG TPA: hypothetical protein VF258_03325 [Luteolibacter sp.]
MKSTYLLPVATAFIGFSIAWLAKPDATPAPSAVKVGETAPRKPVRAAPGNRPSDAASQRSKQVKASDFPLADQADQGPKTRDEAKMLRLTEALGLSLDQQGALIQLIEKVQASTNATAPVIEDLTARGKAIQEGLAKLLTPDQLAKFEELRLRERENRIEVRSQKMLTAAIDEIDLSPEQREEVLNRLREKSKAELQAIPAAATLLFDKSLLPTNGRELSADGILLLAKMSEDPPVGEPMAVHQQFLDRKRGELEELLKCFDGILTPGQMGQYQAALAETRAIIDKLPEKPAPQGADARATSQPKPVRVDPGPVEIPESEEEAEDVSEADADMGEEEE